MLIQNAVSFRAFFVQTLCAPLLNTKRSKQSRKVINAKNPAQNQILTSMDLAYKYQGFKGVHPPKGMFILWEVHKEIRDKYERLSSSAERELCRIMRSETELLRKEGSFNAHAPFR